MKRWHLPQLSLVFFRHLHLLLHPAIHPSGTQQLFLSSAIDPSGTQQLFLQFVQTLDNKSDHKLTSFKRKFDEKEDLHASQLKKLKLKSKATNLFKLKGNKIQYEFNVASIDRLESFEIPLGR